MRLKAVVPKQFYTDKCLHLGARSKFKSRSSDIFFIVLLFALLKKKFECDKF